MRVPLISIHTACAGSDASPTWYAPYQEHELRADLKALDCNVASCDNPRPAVAILSRLRRDVSLTPCCACSACGIPVCRGVAVALLASLALDPLLAGISTLGDWAESAAYWRGAARSSCDGAGCDIEKYAQVVASTFPDDRNVQDTIDSTVDRSGQSRPMAVTDSFPCQFLPGIRFGVYLPPIDTPPD